MDETDLLHRLRLKDKEAFDELVRTYGPRLLRAARLITGNNQYAEELTSDTFAEAYLALPRYRAESSLFNWLYAIMLNQFRYQCRQKRRYVPLDQDVIPVVQTPEQTNQTNLIKNLPKWLSQISDEYREVIILKYLEQKKIEEIASILDIPIGTVKSRIHNALESLRKIIKDMNLLTDSATN
jgi:RNA polymerase sigma-70 factor (ECF subfamily)